MSVLYKLASQDPYYLDTVQAFTDLEDQSALMWQLYAALYGHQELVVQRLNNLLSEGRYFEDEEMRYDFYRDIVPLLTARLGGVSIEHCCWCYGKALLLDRIHGFGKFLHQQQGIQRTYDQGIRLFVSSRGDLIAFETKPKFSDDTITNKQLITEEQLQQLLALEKKYGKIFAPTCKKKDVLNLFRLEKLGLLNKDFTPTYEQQQEWLDVSIQRQREEALDS